MIDRIRIDIQALLDELRGAIDKLRRAPGSHSRGSEPDDVDRTASVAGSASAGENTAKSPRARWTQGPAEIRCRRTSFDTTPARDGPLLG